MPLAEPVLGFRRLEAKKKNVATYQKKKKKFLNTADSNLRRRKEVYYLYAIPLD